jgi:hypothetical protein
LLKVLGLFSVGFGLCSAAVTRGSTLIVKAVPIAAASGFPMFLFHSHLLRRTEMVDQWRANGDRDFWPDKVPIGTRTQSTKGALVHMDEPAVTLLWRCRGVAAADAWRSRNAIPRKARRRSQNPVPALPYAA